MIVHCDVTYFYAPIRIEEHLNENLMKVGRLFGHCQSNLVKAHPHSPEEAEFWSVKLLKNNT